MRRELKAGKAIAVEEAREVSAVVPMRRELKGIFGLPL